MAERRYRLGQFVRASRSSHNASYSAKANEERARHSGRKEPKDKSVKLNSLISLCEFCTLY